MDPESYFERHVFVCVNVRPEGHPRGCCSGKGSVELRDHIKVQAGRAGLSRVRINGAMCLDRCDLGPVLVIYPEGVWYRCENRTDADEIVERHLKGGERVERLMLTAKDKTLADFLARTSQGKE